VNADSGEADTHTLQLAVAGQEDPRWELTRVDLLLDGESLESIEVIGSEAAESSLPAERSARDDGDGGASPDGSGSGETPRPLWFGQVAPGPHNLAALLFFRPRTPAVVTAGSSDTVIRLETMLHPDRAIRPLVILITPVRPGPAPLDAAPQVRLSFAAVER
jgi:hypothetical protein